MVTIDFETYAVEDGKALLPKPVGFAVRYEDGCTKYYAFGHPDDNNCSWEEARAVLLSIWDREFVGHNIHGFDIPVAEHWFQLPKKDPLTVHCTLLLSYLHDPHVPQLNLKALAQRWLGMEPSERDELHDWIIRHVPGATRKTAGAYISKAPAALVGPYASADVTMTWQLFQHVVPLVLPTMEQAYNRERLLAPILAEIQNRGVRCDVARLRDDTQVATQRLHNLDAEVRLALNAPDLSLDSNDELVRVLTANGYDGFLPTATGKRSAAKRSLDHALGAAPGLRGTLRARATYATLVSTFMHPWLEIATNTGGTIHAAYNQVRNPEGFGTRTGRLSSSRPNFQNVPNDLGDEYPKMRSYLLPDEGHVWTCGDFASQEPRLAAHFEDGALCRAYNADPDMDPYMFVVDLVGGITRKESKTIFLGLLYAMGGPTLAGRLECELHRATMLRNMIRAALPDIVQLDLCCKRRFQAGACVRTLGGRHYFCEPPANGRTWEYKALNTLIQGSAADQTKQAIIEIDREAKLLDNSCRVLGTVHDEISVSHPPHLTDKIREIMVAAANALPCDVPMTMSFKSGATWHEAAK